jgi:hypothetical protein
MVTNLYNEVVMSIEDICETLEQRAMRNGIFNLYYNLNSEKQGIWTSPKPHVSLHGLPGLYSIFRHNQLMYIGKSSKDIGMRLGRFVKEVNNQSRLDENHPAGDKWRRFFGESNLDGCQIMFSEYYPFEIESSGYTYTQIEKHLIKRHQPLLNRK